MKLLGIQISVARVSWPKIDRITQAYCLSQLPLLVWIVQLKPTHSSDTDIFFQHISSYLLLTIYGPCFFTCHLTANTVINCSSCKFTFIEIHNWSTILIYLHFKYLCVLLLSMSTPLYLNANIISTPHHVFETFWFWCKFNKLCCTITAKATQQYKTN